MARISELQVTSLLPWFQVLSSSGFRNRVPWPQHRVSSKDGVILSATSQQQWAEQFASAYAIMQVPEQQSCWSCELQAIKVTSQATLTFGARPRQLGPGAAANSMINLTGDLPDVG